MYTESERRIFPYHDGRAFDGDGKPASVCGDPLAIYEAICAALDGDPDSVIENAFAGIPREGELNEDGSPAQVKKELEPTRYQARCRIEKASRFAFDLAPFDRKTGRGCTRAEALDLFWRFLDWIDGQKKSTEPSPT